MKKTLINVQVITQSHGIFFKEKQGFSMRFSGPISWLPTGDRSAHKSALGQCFLPTSLLFSNPWLHTISPPTHFDNFLLNTCVNCSSQHAIKMLTNQTASRTIYRAEHQPKDQSVSEKISDFSFFSDFSLVLSSLCLGLWISLNFLMGSWRRRVLAVFVVVVVIMAVAASRAEAARPAPAEAEERLVDCGEGGYESMVYPAMVEKAKETVELLLARLPAGPSPKGPGHWRSLWLRFCVFFFHFYS